MTLNPRWRHDRQGAQRTPDRQTAQPGRRADTPAHAKAIFPPCMAQRYWVYQATVSTTPYKRTSMITHLREVDQTRDRARV